MDAPKPVTDTVLTLPDERFMQLANDVQNAHKSMEMLLRAVDKQCKDRQA